jgi:hypothetical protein
LKNILLDFKNGHNRFITSVGLYPSAASGNSTIVNKGTCLGK